MNRSVSTHIFMMFAFICGIILTFTLPALGATTYRVQGDVPKFPDSEFKEAVKPETMGTIKITATTKDAFSNPNQVFRAEFRLPNDFYITSAGQYGGGVSEDVEVQRGKGFENSNQQVKINCISEDRNNPGQFRGFELIVDSIVQPDDYPELVIYFNNVYVPRGYKGNVEVTTDVGESGGFSGGKFTIAIVQAAQLKVEAESEQFLVGDSHKLGPIKISENMAGAFEYIELTLPGGYTWVKDSCYIDPMLGLRLDLNRDGNYDVNDFIVTVTGDKYGQSVLRVETLGRAKSTSLGKLTIECNVDMEEGIAAYGDVAIRVDGNADPTPVSLKVAGYTEQQVSITAENTKPLYGGLLKQDIANIVIAENAPDTLVNGRDITLKLPEWAKWSGLPTIQVEGGNYLDIGPAHLENEDRTLVFKIDSNSQDKPGKIRIKDGKVNLALDAEGDLLIGVGGGAGVSGDVNAGKVSPPITVAAKSAPALKLAQRGQTAGEIEIKEPAGRIILAGELWLDFPTNLVLVGTPVVKTTAGNLNIKEPRLDKTNNQQRLIIPVNCSSSTAATLLISNIVFDIGQLAPDGDVKVKVGGPAINEVNRGAAPLFDNQDWVTEVVIAAINSPGSAVVPAPAPRTVIFKLGDKSYEVNGQKFEMDVTPLIIDNRTFVPLRYAGMALGVEPQDIIWDGDSLIASLKKKDIFVQVKLGETAIYRSGVRIAMDVAAFARDNRTFVPLRAIATAFGVGVNWDQATNTITLTQPI